MKVKVGWVKGLNRLYFLYESTDSFYDFADPGLHNDIFELVVDGDLSGEPLDPRFRLIRRRPMRMLGGRCLGWGRRTITSLRRGG